MWRLQRVSVSESSTKCSVACEGHLRLCVATLNGILLAAICMSTTVRERVLLRFRGNDGYANAPQCYTYIAFLLEANTTWVIRGKLQSINEC